MRKFRSGNHAGRVDTDGVDADIVDVDAVDTDIVEVDCVAGEWTAWTRTELPGEVTGVDFSVVASAVNLMEFPTW